MRVGDRIRTPIIVALDFATDTDTLALVEDLDPERCRVKIGKELFTRCGPRLVEKIVAMGYQVFLDLKFHDIPNTVAGACRAAADLGVWMVNVHTLGGERMLAAARDALENLSDRPLLAGVTVLTSMGDADVARIGLSGTAADSVQRLALLARDTALDGIVCSSHEVESLRRDLGDEFLLVTPGIRPAWAEHGDQIRVTTPADALRRGASYLVIGRPITAAPKPLEALEMVEAELPEIYR